MPRLKADINPAWLNERVKHSPLKQRALAQLCGVSEYVFSRWCSGVTRVPQAKIHTLEGALDWADMVFGAKIPTVRKERQ